MLELEVTLDLDAVQRVNKLTRDTRPTLVKALNKVARDQRVEAARRVQAQLALPASYLRPSAGNLAVSQQATQTHLEARISARSRPTSLARYAQRGRSGQGGVTVEVKPGQARFLRRAFFVKLNAGRTLDVDSGVFNEGLAIRLRPGERLRNVKRVPYSRNAKGLFLLYAPSIQQAFLNNAEGGIADELAQPTAQALERETVRLLEAGL